MSRHEGFECEVRAVDLVGLGVQPISACLGWRVAHRAISAHPDLVGAHEAAQEGQSTPPIIFNNITRPGEVFSKETAGLKTKCRSPCTCTSVLCHLHDAPQDLLTDLRLVVGPLGCGSRPNIPVFASRPDCRPRGLHPALRM